MKKRSNLLLLFAILFIIFLSCAIPTTRAANSTNTKIQFYPTNNANSITWDNVNINSWSSSGSVIFTTADGKEITIIGGSILIERSH